jgi:O-antigen/teichoic acid export membrane protein
LIASSTILQSFNVIDLYFQSKVLSKYVSIANSFSLGLSSLFKIILILNDAPLVAFALVMILDTAILVVGLVYVYLKKRVVIDVVGQDFSFLGWSFSWSVAKRLLTDSWPLIFAGLAVSVYMRIDQVMLKQMVDVEAVGNYAAALRLSEAWYFIPMAVVSSVFPAIVNSKKHSNALYLKRLQDLYTLMVWMAIAVAGLVSFSSDWLVVSLYGESYAQASGVLTVHIWTGVFVFLGVAFSAFLTAEQLTLKVLYRSILGAIINIGFNYLLIPHYGVLGAAMGTLVGNIFANVIYDIFDKSLWPHFHLKLKAFFPIYLIR